MQAGNAVRGTGVVMRRRLMVLLAVLLIVTWVMLLALTGARASGVGTENAAPNAAPTIDLSSVAAYVH